MKPLDVNIRWLIRRDMPEVLRIERECFPCPWSEDEFLCYLRERHTIGNVCEVGQQIVGFMIYELHPKRLQLINLAVDPAYRWEGAGRAMIGKLVSKLVLGRRERIAAEVNERNLPGQLFFRGCGFRAVKVLQNASDDGSAAYRMEYRLAWPATVDNGNEYGDSPCSSKP